MNISKLRIATRTSPLAMWQANFVKEEINKIFPELLIEFVGIVTTADKMLSIPLTKIGGKGLFVKELETALLENKADIAVHSIKDMPMTLPAGLTLGVVCKRDDPRDAFVSDKYTHFAALPKNAIVGTSSLRRQAQLLAKRSDLTIKNLRGNVGTRLGKLDANEFDAIILAAAGLKRLNESSRINDYLSTDDMLPSAGQGAIGIECRENDEDILKIIATLEDSETRTCILAERTLTTELGGSCQVPIASYAKINNNMLIFKGLVARPDGSLIIRSATTVEANHNNAIKAGHQVAEDLTNQGALTILQEILENSIKQ